MLQFYFYFSIGDAPRASVHQKMLVFLLFSDVFLSAFATLHELPHAHALHHWAISFCFFFFTYSRVSARVSAFFTYSRVSVFFFLHTAELVRLDAFDPACTHAAPSGRRFLPILVFVCV
jgi:hypothetical protein